MSAGKTTFFLVPGAWHRFGSFAGFADRLRAAGYVVEGASLASTAGDGTVGVAEDAAMIAREITRLSDSGQSVVPIFHSYSGVPGTQALPGLSVTERQAEGKTGGVLGIVYATAFIPRKDQSLKDIVGGVFPDYMQRDEEKGTLTIGTDPVPLFYSSCPAAAAQELAAALVPQSEKSFLEPCTQEGYAASVYDGRRVYIHCEQDQALTLPVQEALVAASGVQWMIKRIEADHTPFVSSPDALIKELGAAIEEFGQVQT